MRRNWLDQPFKRIIMQRKNWKSIIQMVWNPRMMRHRTFEVRKVTHHYVVHWDKHCQSSNNLLHIILSNVTKSKLKLPIKPIQIRQLTEVNRAKKPNRDNCSGKNGSKTFDRLISMKNLSNIFNYLNQLKVNHNLTFTKLSSHLSFSSGIGLNMSPETVVISLATSLHLYANSRPLFGQNKQFQKNPTIYIQRDQPLIDVRQTNKRKDWRTFLFFSMWISPMSISELKKKKSMHYVNVFNKQCLKMKTRISFSSSSSSLLVLLFCK